MKTKITNYLQRFRKKNDAAAIAKERLQIIISHERSQQQRGPDYLPKLQQELLDVIAKYVKVDKEQVVVQLERSGDNAVLELNVTIPETAESA